MTGFASFSGETPSNWISEKDIVVLDDRVILYVDGATLSSYFSSKSMSPLLGSEANGIRVVPRVAEEISVGDIISFRIGDNLIVHRVVKKGIDSKGIYFVTQGDNNAFVDDKIRFEDIEFVTVGIIW